MIASETIAAAGMADAFTPKCLRAKTYARVGDLLKVSTTTARLDGSDIDVKCVNKRASPPPIIGNRQEAVMAAVTKFILLKDETELAAPPATNINVAIMATLGHDGTIS